MADSNSTQVHSTRDMGDVINTIDCLSQEGFSSIAAIASLALLAMETSPVGNTENIIQALRTIRGKARDIENCINYEAETVGCNYKEQ